MNIAVRIKHWFTRHEYHWVRNVYGDEINLLNARTVYRCHCGAVKYVKEFWKD